MRTGETPAVSPWLGQNSSAAAAPFSAFSPPRSRIGPACIADCARRFSSANSYSTQAFSISRSAKSSPSAPSRSESAKPFCGDLQAAAAFPTQNLSVDQDEFKPIGCGRGAIQRALAIPQACRARVQGDILVVSRIQMEAMAAGRFGAQRDVSGQDELDIVQPDGLDAPGSAIVKQGAAAVNRRTQDCVFSHHQANSVAIAGVMADEVVVLVQEMRCVEDDLALVVLHKNDE